MSRPNGRILAPALLVALMIVTPILADTYYFVRTYDGEPQEPYPWLEAEVMEVSSDSACSAPEGFTSVTLSELHGMDLDSPAEVYEDALADSTAWPVTTGNYWHYSNYFYRLPAQGGMKKMCAGSKVWRDLLHPGDMGLQLRTWWRLYMWNQPYVMLREQLRGVKWGWEYNSYGKWSYPSNWTMQWKEEGWFDDGDIENQVYRVDFTIW